MSSAYDEAKDGQPHDDSEDDSQQDLSAHYKNHDPGHDHKSATTRPHKADANKGNDEEEEEEDEDSMTIGSDLQLENGVHIYPDAASNRNVLRDTLSGNGRPSSADGSFSIPDDTPSVQVVKIFSRL